MAKINRRNALKWFATTAGVLAFTGKAMAKECSSCKGSGTGPFDCSFCKGTGRSGGSKCTFCNGKGFQKCGICNGKGQV